MWAEPQFLGVENIPVPGSAGTAAGAAAAPAVDAASSAAAETAARAESSAAAAAEPDAEPLLESGARAAAALAALEEAAAAASGRADAQGTGEDEDEDEDEEDGDGKSADYEMHIRRLDDEQFVHRRLVTSVRIAADPDVIWQVRAGFKCPSRRLHALGGNSALPASETSLRYHLRLCPPRS